MPKSYLLVVVGLAVVASLVACGGGAETEVDDVEAVLSSARAYLEAGEYEEAIDALEAAEEEAADNSDVHFLLGQAYNQSGELSKAADAFQQVLELEPDSAAAHHNLGVTYYQLQDLRSAVDEFEKALEIDPDDPDTHYQLGAAFLTLALSSGDPSAPADAELLEQATAEFEAALELRENMPEALIGLGNVRLQEGAYGEAIEMLEQAIESVPESREAHYALAGALAQSGDVEGACETYDQFLALDPPATWKTQAEQARMSLGCE
jgi:tetratricopeptide (TPR) repeat protein